MERKEKRLRGGRRRGKENIEEGEGGERKRLRGKEKRGRGRKISGEKREEGGYINHHFSAVYTSTICQGSQTPTCNIVITQTDTRTNDQHGEEGFYS